MGDPQLLRVSEAVRELDSPRLRELLADMRDTISAGSCREIATAHLGKRLRIVRKCAALNDNGRKLCMV